LKSRSSPIAQVFAPLRLMPQRFAFPVLVLASVMILLVGHFNRPLATQARVAVADVLAPVLEIVHQPVAAAANAVRDVRETVSLFQENARLRAENATLLRWQSVAQQLQAENAALRALTHYQPTASTFFVTAEVVGTAGGAFSRSLLIDRGADDGVAEGQAAFSGNGLVGRVVEVGRRAARTLLISDLNSRIPVRIEATRDHAILAGDNTDQPLLIYLPNHASIHVGDRVVTSGDGGIFPPDLPVGVIASNDDGTVRVEPFTDLSQIDYLRITDFGLSGVLPTSAIPLPRAVPAKHLRAKTAGRAP
jgi:rod shape-determining protein MreC